MKLIFVLIILAVSFVSSADIDNNIVEEFNSGEQNVDVIVEMRNESFEIGALQLNNRFDSLDDIVDGEKIAYQFENSIAMEIDERDLRALSKNVNVESVVKMGKIYALLQDSVDIINASSTWKLKFSGINLTGAGQTVCVIDSGINYSHPDLVGNYLGGYDFVDGDDDPMDEFWHGTHVAGIIAGNGGITGVAPDAGIIAIRILDEFGAGSPDDLASAIDWCVDNASRFNISVISMSLGCNATVDGYTDYCDAVNDGCYNIAIAHSINNAVAKNISVVAASGNSGSVVGISSPACIQNVSAVSSIDKNGLISSFSDRNSLVNLFAPGRNINSTYSFGGYTISDGTSMATPMVAGAIALINQYLNLSGQRKTPSEIENILNDTGKRINDSGGSGLSFSIVDIYNAILFLDIDAPNVTLVSPINDTIDMNTNQTFVCNATDWQLENVTLNVWNSSGVLYYNATNDLSETLNITNFNVTGISEGNYFWNCLGVDVLGNFGYASNNLSLIIGGISTTLLLPGDDSYTNINDTNFSCRVASDSEHVLKNVTFNLWNSSEGLVYNLTKNVSGFDNTSVFNYSFVDDGNYFWNCFGANNGSNFSWSNFNYSFVFDATTPTLILTDLPTSATTNSVLKNFGFNVSDDNLANCSLIIGNEISLTNSSMNFSLPQIFSKVFTPGTYSWKINCSDFAGNVNSSDENVFVITAPLISGSSSPSGGGGGSASISSVPKIYEVNVVGVTSGYTQKLKKNDKVNFSIFDFEGGRHLLSIDEVGDDYVELIIESEPINLRLGVGQSAKLNLTSLIYYDLFVKLNAIVGDAAELTIQLINEPIEVKVVNVVDKEIIETEVEVVGNYLWIVLVLVVVLVGIVFVVIKLNRKKLKG